MIDRFKGELVKVGMEIIDLASFMADEAGKIARSYFRTPMDIVSKDDATPVTKADREIETRLREILADARPDDGILGEEYGPKHSSSGFTWVLDPIDGTKSFTIGRATFGTLMGLCENEKPILGIIDQPVSRERWMGITGKPTVYNGASVSTRRCAELSQAIFATGSPAQITQNDAERFERLDRNCRYSVFQGDCYFYGLMASGLIDVIVEDMLGVYDYIALVPIIEGAEGAITDWNGSKLTLSSGSNVVAVGNKILLKPAIKLIEG